VVRSIDIVLSASRVPADYHPIVVDSYLAGIEVDR